MGSPVRSWRACGPGAIGPTLRHRARLHRRRSRGTCTRRRPSSSTAAVYRPGSCRRGASRPAKSSWPTPSPPDDRRAHPSLLAGNNLFYTAGILLPGPCRPPRRRRRAASARRGNPIAVHEHIRRPLTGGLDDVLAAHRRAVWLRTASGCCPGDCCFDHRLDLPAAPESRRRALRSPARTAVLPLRFRSA